MLVTVVVDVTSSSLRIFFNPCYRRSAKVWTSEPPLFAQIIGKSADKHPSHYDHDALVSIV